MHRLILVTTVAALAVMPAMSQAQRMRGAPNPGGAMKPMTPRPGGSWTTPRPGGTWTMPRPGPRPGGTWTTPRPGGGSWAHNGRWGGRVNGRWYAGVYAPGGWNAYRRPVTGWILPTYWYSPSFYISDYSSYGLGAPQSGYTWTRYYDDAVLVDGRGRVYDSVSGLDWDRYDGGATTTTTETYVDGRRVDGYSADGRTYRYADDGPGRPDARRYDDRRGDDGVGGALIGAAVGGVAGNVIAGRGDKLGGTLLGAGAGALAGMAIDKAEDKGRVHHGGRAPLPPVAPDYGDDYPVAPDDVGARYAPPPRDGRGYPPPSPPVRYAPPSEVVQSARSFTPGERLGYDSQAFDARPYTTVSYGPGTVTTTTVIPATTTTTETTEIYYEDVVTQRARTRTWKPKKVHRAKPRQCTCVCRTVCR